MRTVSRREGTLSLTIVATPIGNLKDISLRALEALQEADYILCEDTRRAAKLKSHYQLKPKLVSFHEHNERTRVPQILARLQAGKKFALISDAGTPLISDPGYLLVQELIRNNLPFTCVPGPSAVTTALLLSGMPVHRYSFYGFLPTGAGARTDALRQMAQNTNQTVVLFESPDRIVGLLREVGEILGDRPVALCREMTKLHEEVLRGPVAELLPRIAGQTWKGEFTVVIGPGEERPVFWSEESIRERYRQLEAEQLNRKDILKRLSRESGRSRNDLYRLIYGKK